MNRIWRPRSLSHKLTIYLVVATCLLLAATL
jgi:hypothetical protein